MIVKRVLLRARSHGVMDINRMPPPPVPADIKQIADRLRAVREALDLQQKEAAAAAGVQPPRWNQWERGERLASLVEVRRFCDAYNVTLDFIFRGKMDGLPSDTRRKVVSILTPSNSAA